MLVYFMRHGETPWNAERRVQGQTATIDLTPLGVSLAEQTRDGLAEKGIFFDAAFASPLRSAARTAEIVMERQRCALTFDSRLREMCFGPYEGTCAVEGKYVDENFRNCFCDPEKFVPAGDGESFADVERRLADFVDTVLRPCEATCRKVLVVTHGGMMRTLVRRIDGRPLSDIWKGRQPNGCVHIVDFTGGAMRMLAQAVVFYDSAFATQTSSF